MSKLFILRGPSGSGKSTIASYLAGQHDCDVCEADNFFYSKRSYKFDAAMLPQAHTWCRLETEKALFLGEDIVVANTNMPLRDLQPYLDLGNKYGAIIEVIRTPGPWDISTLFKRNVHEVPSDILERQIARYQTYASETEWTEMSIFS